MPVNTEFARWAVDFSGMDGGNINSGVWICGIEPNLGLDPQLLGVDEFSYQLPNGQRVPCWNEQFRGRFTGYLGWLYDQKVAKILLHQNGRALADYHTYMEEELYSQNGSCFKLNLYPLSAPRTTSRWTRGHYDVTGLETMVLYRAWCIRHRFPFIRGLVDQYMPTVVVVTSGSTFRSDFILAFANADAIFQPGSMHPLETKCRYVEEIGVNGGSTRLLIAPFLGSGGITADADLRRLANIISAPGGG